MGKFDTYFLMDAEDVAAYVFEKTFGEGEKKIPWDRETLKAEIPKEHGNLNYVFRVWDDKGHSLYLKQAGLETRISKDMKASLDRNRLESELLLLQNRLAPGMVPEIYFYDTVMNACGMEDCSDYTVMRNAMVAHQTYPEFANLISTFMVQTLLPTTDIVMDHREKKELQRQFISPDLCDITEKLVLMEPYGDQNGRNDVYPPNAAFVKTALYDDEALKLEVAKLKFRFMTYGEALLHGDLHTGSIFIKPGAIKVFDCEFGTYAPIGYDVGNVIANLIFAYANGVATRDAAFVAWTEQMVNDTIDLFKEKFLRLYEEKVTEPMARVKGFRDAFLKGILRDTSGYAGTELHRRTVGMAGVLDLKSLTNPKERLLAERICIYAGKTFIMQRDEMVCGRAYIDALKRATEKAEQSL